MIAWAQTRIVTLPDGRRVLQGWELQSDVLQGFAYANSDEVANSLLPATSEEARKYGLEPDEETAHKQREEDKYTPMTRNKTPWGARWRNTEGNWKTGQFATKKEAREKVQTALAAYTRHMQPLIQHNEELLLKAMLNLAKKEGLDGVMFADAKTVTRAEGHSGSLETRDPQNVFDKFYSGHSSSAPLLDNEKGKILTMAERDALNKKAEQEEMARHRQRLTENPPRDWTEIEGDPKNYFIKAGVWAVESSDGRLYALAHDYNNAKTYLKTTGVELLPDNTIVKTNSASEHPFVKLRQITEADLAKTERVYVPPDSASGMLANYDKKIPNLLKKLTGAEPEKVSTGEDFHTPMAASESDLPTKLEQEGFDKIFGPGDKVSGYVFPVKDIQTKPFEMFTPKQAEPQTKAIQAAVDCILTKLI